MLLLALVTAAQAAPSDRLSAFRPLLGACWRAEFSATVTDTHCFEAVYGGAHVRDRHEVRDGGKSIYAGETVYSADGGDLVFTYFNSLGGVGQGKVRPVGDTIDFTGVMRASPDKAQEAIDSEWRVVGEDRYEVRSLPKPGASPTNKPVVFTRIK